MDTFYMIGKETQKLKYGVWAARNGMCILSQPKCPFYEAFNLFLL